MLTEKRRGKVNLFSVRLSLVLLEVRVVFVEDHI
jgi:hypothetical protein